MKKFSGLLIFVLFLSLGAASANAAALTGWAWSDNFGWISFNSSNPGEGGGPYAVSIDGTTGAWSGYAWSDNLGWITFNASEIPAICSVSPQALLNKTTGAVTGWAYVLTYGTNDAGCVELSGTNHTSPSGGGVTYNPVTGKFTGYAWAGNTVSDSGPGWIDFNANGTDSVTCTSGDCGYGTVSGTCSATTPYQNINSGSPVTFRATPSIAGSYDYSWNLGTWNIENPDNEYTATYNSTSPGPTVRLRSQVNGNVSNSITCPTVTVLNSSSNTFKVGRTPATATADTFTVRQLNQFALKWNITLGEDYSCSPDVTNSSGQSVSNSNWNSNWKQQLFNSPVNNGDETKTWMGDTGTAPSGLYAGTVQNPITPGIYRFTVACSGEDLPTQSWNVTVKVNSSSQSEI